MNEITGCMNVVASITGLPDGNHGFHVHEYGDSTPNACMNSCVSQLRSGLFNNKSAPQFLYCSLIVPHPPYASNSTFMKAVLNMSIGVPKYASEGGEIAIPEEPPMSFDEAKPKLKELLGEAVEELVGRGPSGEADDCGSGLLSKNWKDRADAITGLADAFASKGETATPFTKALFYVLFHKCRSFKESNFNISIAILTALQKIAGHSKSLFSADLVCKVSSAFATKIGDRKVGSSLHQALLTFAEQSCGIKVVHRSLIKALAKSRSPPALAGLLNFIEARLHYRVLNSAHVAITLKVFFFIQRVDDILK